VETERTRLRFVMGGLVENDSSSFKSVLVIDEHGEVDGGVTVAGQWLILTFLELGEFLFFACLLSLLDTDIDVIGENADESVPS
jgi:hypothetical protein